jgi:hypothetical protein
MKKLWIMLRAVPPIMLFTALSVLSIPAAMWAWIAYLLWQGQPLDVETLSTSLVVTVACGLAGLGVIFIGKLLRDDGGF